MKLSLGIFYLLILLLPTQLGRHFWPDWTMIDGLRIDYLSPTLYLSDLLVFFLIVNFLPNFRTLFKSPFFLLAVFILLLSFLSAKNIPVAIFKFFKILELIFFGYFIAKNTSFIKEKNIFSLLILGVSLEIFLAFWQFVKQGSVGGIFWWLGERTFDSQTSGIAQTAFFGQLLLRPYGTFSHPNVLAGYLVTVLPLIFIFLPSSLAQRTIYKLVFFFSILTVFLSFSLSSLFVLFFLTFPFLCRSFFSGRRIPFLLLFLFPITLFLYLYLPSFSFSEKEESFQKRISLNSAALTMMEKYPLNGIGLNNFLVRLPEFYKEKDFVRFLQPAHNFYLLLGSEIGIIGLGFLLVFFFLSLKKQRARKKYHLLVSFLSFLVLNFFDHYFYTQNQAQLLISLILGLSWRKNVKP